MKIKALICNSKEFKLITNSAVKTNKKLPSFDLLGGSHLQVINFVEHYKHAHCYMEDIMTSFGEIQCSISQII